MGLEGFKLREFEFEFEGVKYPVWVLKAEACFELRGFVGYLKERKTLLISQEVAERFCNFFLGHEILCREIGGNTPGRCLAATKKEFEWLHQDILLEYSIYRLGFYRRLIEYHRTREQRDEELLREIEASRDFWQREVDKQY